MKKDKIYNIFYDLINGGRNHVLYHKGYKEFEETYEELKEEGQLKKEEQDGIIIVTSDYQSLIRIIRDGKIGD